MKAPSITTWIQLTGVALSLLLVSCTDRREPRPNQVLQSDEPLENLQAVGDVRVTDPKSGQVRDTAVYSMYVKGNSLFMTGKPFAFTRWDIGATPESPDKTFSIGDNLLSFSPSAPVGQFGNWQFSYYANGAVAVWGPLALLSGELGLSIANLSNTAAPTEINRYPKTPPGSTEILRDPAFVYKAIIPHPTQPVVYGFSKEDYLYTLGISGANLNIIKKESYGAPGSTVCCVTSAAYLAGRIYTAFKTRLWVFNVSSSSPTLGAPTIISKLHAVNVVASQNNLYVQHFPVQNSGSTLPAGIYVFDNKGVNVGFLAVSPLVFAVSLDDAYMYANVDDRTVRIFRMSWKSYSGF